MLSVQARKHAKSKEKRRLKRLDKELDAAQKTQTIKDPSSLHVACKTALLKPVRLVPSTFLKFLKALRDTKMQEQQARERQNARTRNQRPKSGGSGAAAARSLHRDEA